MPSSVRSILQRLGDIASNGKPYQLRYTLQEDRAVTWKATAIHPMQVTETFYQRLVTRNVRRATDESEKQEIATAMLQLAFQLGIDAPSPMLPDTGGQTPNQLVQHATQALRLTASVLEQARLLNQVLTPAEMEEQAARIAEARKKLQLAVHHFHPQLLRLVEWVPEVRAALVQLFRPHADLAGEVEALRAAADSLDIVTRGYASVQMTHILDAFYLFRLLLRFRMESDQPLTETLQNEASGDLTGLLHNHPDMAWLGRWLRAKLVDLTRSIRQHDVDGDIVFFLKGGRALARNPEEGQNDWDTQLLINPHLPPAIWYQKFAKLHELLLSKLTEYKNEFYLLLSVQRPLLEDYVNRLSEERERQGAPRALQGPDANEAGPLVVAAAERVAEEWGLVEQFPAAPGPIDFPVPQRVETASTKAELIDIGIPRRESPEAFEQWALVRPRLIDRGGLQVPSGLFFAIDFIQILREVFSGESRSAAKAPKRARRLFEVLGTHETRTEIQGEMLLITGALQQLAQTLWQQQDQRRASVLVLFLRQLFTAYDLQEDRGLAQQLATLIPTALAQLDQRVELPQPLRQDLNADEAALARTVGLVQLIGDLMLRHMQARAALLNANAEAYRRLLMRMEAASRNLPNGIRAQLAVVGSAAAGLQAGRAGFTRMGDLEPVYRLDVKVFVPPDADQNRVRDAILNALAGEAQVLTSLGLRVETPSDSPPGTALFFWGQAPSISVPAVLAPAEGQLVPVGNPQQVGEPNPVQLQYSLLLMRLLVERTPEPWPQVNVINQLPVLNPRDLLIDYKRRVGEVDEYSNQRMLKSAVAAMTELLTTFDNLDVDVRFQRQAQGP